MKDTLSLIYFFYYGKSVKIVRVIWTKFGIKLIGCQYNLRVYQITSKSNISITYDLARVEMLGDIYEGDLTTWRHLSF